MTTEDAIRTHGAQAVYDAASRHMAGDKVRGLACVGLSAKTMGDVWDIQSAAYAELGEGARAIDYAKSQADLSAIERKQTLDMATSAYEAEKSRLTEAGMKSAERYAALKTLKAEQDAANSAYVKFTHGQIRNELDKIITAQTPAQRAEGLRRARDC